MKPTDIAWIASAVLFGGLGAGPAVANEQPPIEGHAAVFLLPPHGDIPYFGSHYNYLDIGAEAELGPTGGFWCVGAGSWTSIYVNPSSAWEPGDTATTVWGRLHTPRIQGHELSVLAGANYNLGSYPCIGTCAPTTPYGLLLGVSWQYRTDHWWLRLTPQYTIPLFGERQTGGWMLATVPWAEIAYRMTPQLDLSFRLGPAPLKVNWNF